MKRTLVLNIGIVSVLLCISYVSSISVMSVDLGTEWMKVAIVSPGVPMEIALNKESKRKTPVAIAFRDGERTFGEDALTVGVRFPKNCYTYLLDLLGKQMDNPLVKLFQKRFPYYELVADPERGTVLFKHDSETAYSPEELLGMLLHKAKEFAETSAGQTISEAVLTVPGYFNQAERKALLQAAHLAGLKVLQLINDYTAVALNYGIFRRKDFNETAQYVMFYDMGAASTSATIVSYQLVKIKDRGITETHPQVSVIGVGYDRTLGGLEMQLRLRDFLAKKFNEMKKTTKNVLDNPRAMAKLFKEAGRVKTVLSANADHFAQVEGLIDEIDFRMQVTRDEFESLNKDLFDRVKVPIENALKSSGLTLDVINQIVLSGAGTRVPFVQDRLAAAIKMELSKNLNTDEAAVLGAAYKAADLSTGFKVKKVITKDAVLFPVQVTFARETEGGDIKQVKRTLFGVMNPFPQKKIITFNKHKNDFTFSVNYADLDHLPQHEIEALGSLNITEVSLSGVSTALEKHSAPTVESKGVKAHFSLDDSGVLNLVNVELVLEKTVSDEENSAQEESPLSKLGSTISKLFTGPDEALKENIEKPVHEEPEEARDSEASSEKKESTDETSNRTPEETAGQSEDNKKNTSSADADKKKPKVVVIKEEIKAEERILTVQSMGEKQLMESLGKIEALNEYDVQKSRREGALNALESFVFDAKQKLDSEEDYIRAATSEEAEKIRKLCAEIFEWLDEEGFGADAATYETKLKELKEVTRPVYIRVDELKKRPEAIAALESTINGSRGFLLTIKNMTAAQPAADSEEHPVFTPVEIETLERVINETQEWKEKMIAEQAKLSLTEPPKLTVKALVEKMALLDREVKYLVHKAKFWRPKKKEEATGKESSQNKTDKQDTTGSESEKENESEDEKIIVGDEEISNETEKAVPVSTKDESDEAGTHEDKQKEQEETSAQKPSTTRKDEQSHTEL